MDAADEPLFAEFVLYWAIWVALMNRRGCVPAGTGAGAALEGVEHKLEPTKTIAVVAPRTRNPNRRDGRIFGKYSGPAFSSRSDAC
jgi:hypothetical protein